jgi:hypothetical protein
VEITPELERIISIVAEAQTHVAFGAACPAGSADRAREVEGIRRCTKAARDLLPGIGGFGKLPSTVAITLRACELGADKLSAP